MAGSGLCFYTAFPMLTFKTTTYVFLVAVIIAVSVHVFYTALSWICFAALLATYGLLVFYGSAFIHSGFHMPAVCEGRTPERIISLTFDDGPSSEITPQVLDVLKSEKLKAAFFCIGKSISGKEAILKRIVAEGHLVCNHSYSHAALFDFYSEGRFCEDLSKADLLIQNVTGLKPAYFRPPYGVTTPNLARAVAKQGYTTIGWSIRSLDTTGKSHSDVLERIRKGLKPGAILLFHDTMPGTVQLLLSTIQLCKEQGYRILPLDELIQTQPYA
jgi:peptidoglycan/xylan/chitin deacetylase (PgdA/CDA1 family)